MMAVATGEHRGEPTGREQLGGRTGDSRQPTERDVIGVDHTNVTDEQKKSPADQQHCRSHFGLHTFNISTVAFHLLTMRRMAT